MESEMEITANDSLHDAEHDDSTAHLAAVRPDKIKNYFKRPDNWREIAKHYDEFGFASTVTILTKSN